jgi:hypothetical protein
VTHPLRTLLAVILVVSACDRFWNLSVSAAVPTPMPTDCVRTALGTLEGAESVWVRSYTPDTALVQSTNFLIWSRVGYGPLIISHERGADSLHLLLSYSWVGTKPASDSVQSKARLFSGAIERVARSCWGVQPPVAIEWPR